MVASETEERPTSRPDEETEKGRRWRPADGDHIGFLMEGLDEIDLRSSWIHGDWQGRRSPEVRLMSSSCPVSALLSLSLSLITSSLSVLSHLLLSL
jgi:hypothetical protein